MSIHSVGQEQPVNGPDHASERKKQIVRAAMTCFARRGFHVTTMHDISAQAQISVGLIYRYFENKDAVIAYMAGEHLAGLREVLEEARKAPTLFEGLKIIAICHCEEEPDLQPAFVADLFAEAARNEHVRLMVRDVTQFFIDGLAELIAGSKEAEAARVDPKTAAEIIMDSTRGMTMRAIVDSSTLSASQIRERQLAMLRALWPLLFASAAPAATLERSSA
ncbi:MAG TPA: TetR/AcrR family transcriptional regulator [Candidatus Polarisedimenticolaceae bacterium]|nr:TetR/AcrR family transcriptional regulator [Candidatus Polarisedimenticolaceae bacterium]